VMNECRRFALASREPFGVWGGLGESERRAILERQDVTDDRGIAAAG
jgi:WhiB family transcriptional regulator, redox-sensing transcriptional regulator